MARRKKHTPEQVVNLLRQIEVAVANGKTTSQACSGSTSAPWSPLPLQGVGRSAGGPGAAAEKAGVGERKAEAAGE